MKKETKEKFTISRMVERALVWTAISLFFVGLVRTYNYFSVEDAPIILTIIAIYMLAFSALLWALVIIGVAARYTVPRSSHSGRCSSYSSSASTVDTDYASSGPSVNVDGSPMIGSVDIHGSPYGFSSSDWT
jgi:hypothetical protein